MITPRDRSMLKGLVNSQVWRVLEQVATDMCDEIQREEKVGDTEWETVKKAIADQHEVMGIKRYLNQIINNCQDNE